MYMEQFELFDLPNPCVGVCEANNKGFCKGCLRSRDERLYWIKFNNLQKRQVLRLCRLRRAKLARLASARRQASIELPEQMDFDF